MKYKIIQAAFQGTNGHTYATGPFHDIDQVPHGVTIAHEGFLTDVGDFITREQATADLHVDHPVQSEEIIKNSEEVYGPDHIIDHLQEFDGSGDPYWHKEMAEIVRKHPAWRLAHLPTRSFRGSGVSNREVVKDYAQQSASTAPAIVAYHDGRQLHVLDGSHRLEAARQRRDGFIQAYVPVLAPSNKEISLGKAELIEEEAEDHEFLAFFRSWLAERKEKPTVIKSEDLSELLRLHGHDASLSEIFHETAYRMAGFSPEESPEFKAAKFLSGGKSLPAEKLRAALVAYDEDMEVAALYAYGIPRNEVNLQALRSVVDTQGLDKSEIIADAIPRLVTSFNAAGEPLAQAIRRAYGADTVHKVDFKGKHSGGMAIAVDPKDDRKYLIKPGSGKHSPSLGVKEVSANQSRREVAFAKIARALGFVDTVQDADLLYLDGQEVSCLVLVPKDHKGLDWFKRHEKGFSTANLFEPHRQDGTLFRWATIDFILGNPDRHAGNILINKEGDIKLIDHGSTFAGPSFDPANDSKSFIPAYLRAWYSDNFVKLSPEQRLTHLPSCPRQAEEAYDLWLENIKTEDISKFLDEYGIIDRASIQRFESLRAIPAGERIEALLRFWAGEEQS